MPDPIARFRSWMRAARRAGNPLPEAMVLATADHRGRPSARYVLLKDATARGFVFYSNDESPKGDDMRANRHVSLVFYWHETGRQVRIDGRVKKLPAAEADDYWLERPVGSRLASAASDQSRPVASRAKLMQRYKALGRDYPDGDVPRPAHWIGYLVVPDRIEFWTRAEPRLHKRELFTPVRGAKPKADGRRAWKSTLLQP